MYRFLDDALVRKNASYHQYVVLGWRKWPVKEAEVELAVLESGEGVEDPKALGS